MLFIRRFMQQVCSTPHAPAVVEEGLAVTYLELYQRADDLANSIRAKTDGMMVGIIMDKSADYIVSIVAIHLSGRTAVPLDRGYPTERLRQMISAVDLALCLINRSTRALAQTLLEEQILFLCTDPPRSIHAIPVCADHHPVVTGEEAAYVIFTSGTTGRPKPVLVPYRSLTALVSWMVESPQPPGCTLLYAALGFDVSLQEIYSALCQGDRLLIISEAHRRDLHELTARMSAEAVTRLFLPTSMLIPLVTFDLFQQCELPALAQVIVAGEQLKITPAVRQWFQVHPRCQLINHYGPSETHVVMEYRLAGVPADWPDLPPIGHVVPGSTACLLDDDLQPVAPGSPGQLYVGGPCLALGYFGLPEETAERFIRHSGTGESLYSTGDTCVLNAHGLYEYKGRRDQQCKIRGYRVELKEIEAAAVDSGLVDDCLVVARTFGVTTSLILYFTAGDGRQDISLSMHAHLASRLPEYMLPAFYKKIVAIPLTRNGKANTAELPPVGGLRSRLPLTYVAPHGEVEALICAVTADCLGLDRVGATDNFMALGASSITLISLVAELRHALERDLRQTDLFEFPSPRQLSMNCGRTGQGLPIAESTLCSANSRKRAAAISSIQGHRRRRDV